MKKKGILFFVLAITLSMVLPVYAKGSDTINYESKATLAILDPIDVNGTTYKISISMIVSHRHTRSLPVDKRAIGRLLLIRTGPDGEIFNADLTTVLGIHDYTLPNFSESNNPSLKTSFLIADPEPGGDLEISVDMNWICIEERTTFSAHNPPDGVFLPFDSYKVTFCPAEVSGSINIMDTVNPSITLLMPSNYAQITHFRYVINNSGAKNY